MNFIFSENIRIIRKSILLLQVILCFSFSSIAQKSGIDTLLKRFDNHRRNSLQEKLFLHIDRSYYLAGEILWFKVYNVDGSFHKPLDLSKVAYIEILSPENHPVLQTKVALLNGYGDGSIFLPASLSSGNYQVRAYTNWMKNFEPECYFRSSITIVNTFKEPEPPATIAERYDAQFFPEGGNLVNGLKNRIAFRVINSQGVGVEFKGEVYDQNKNLVASFQPHKFGIGNFSFIPTINQTYTAVITDAHGSSSTYKLPVVVEEGYVMSVRDTLESQIVIPVQKKGETSDERIPFVYLIASTRQSLDVAGARVIKNGKASFLINKKDLGEGISQLTLFDDQLQPVAERLYFKRPERKLEIKVQTDQLLYGKRKKVKLEIASENNSNQSEPANISVAITRNDSLSTIDHDDIQTYLLFTSELNGRIESPEYYFQALDNEALDNLLLTHGWRRFSMKNITDDKKSVPSYIPEYRGHIINGKIVDESGNPISRINTYLSSPGKNIQLFTSRSDERGGIQFETNYFFGAKKIIAQAEPGKTSNYRIELKDPFSEKFASYPMPLYHFKPEKGKQILDRSVAMQAQDIYQGKKINNFSNSIYDTTSFYGKADETYILSDYTRFPTMEDVLREYVPGVSVRKRKDNFYFRVPDNINKAIFKDNPLVLLDGLPIFDLNKIMAFDPLKVRKLEVITRKYYLGYQTYSGVVSYTTYRGDLGGFELDPQSISVDYEGLQQRREFYSPKYETQKQIESRIPDQRNLLYWNPSVTTDKNGKCQIEFYSSDVDGDFKIDVQGITKNGLAGNVRSSFKVSKGN